MGIVLLLALALSGCRESAAPTPTPDPQGLRLALGYDPDPPQAGEGVLIVTVTRADGTPYTGEAAVEVRGDMSHAGMRPEFAEAPLGADGGARLPFNWSMGGDWILTLTVTPTDGAPVSATFEVSLE
jgi:hypothetical protein